MTRDEIIDVVVRDCGYGFSACAVLSDGTRTAHTNELHATPEKAVQAVNNNIAQAIRARGQK